MGITHKQFDEHYWHCQSYHCQKQCQPEVGQIQGVSCYALVCIPEEVRIEDEHEAEIEEETAPDGKMVEKRPVGGFQSTLTIQTKQSTE